MWQMTTATFRQKKKKKNFNRVEEIQVGGEEIGKPFLDVLQISFCFACEWWNAYHAITIVLMFLPTCSLSAFCTSYCWRSTTKQKKVLSVVGTDLAFLQDQTSPRDCSTHCDISSLSTYITLKKIK